MIKIFSSGQIKSIDRYTIEYEPIDSIDLMERAAYRCFQLLTKKVNRSQKIHLFCGIGNNGGDGLALARFFNQHGYIAESYLIGNPENLSNNTRMNLERFTNDYNQHLYYIDSENSFPCIDNEDIVIDCILGSGLNKPINGLIKELVKYLNQSIAYKIAIDIPSGMFADRINNIDEEAFQANETLTLHAQYLSMMFSESEKYTGEINVVDIGLHPKIIQEIPCQHFIIEKKDIIIKKRKQFSHKGYYGHALIVAGSKGMCGAVYLTSKSCLKSGAGLVTAHVPAFCSIPLQTNLPELMLSIDPSEEFIQDVPDITKYQAIAIGPGLRNGEHSYKLLRKLFDQAEVPMVIDADGLNTLAANPNLFEQIPSNTILTPHPGEFDRLAGISINSLERLEKARNLASKFNVIIVLKGANTCTVLPNGSCFFNPTGNAGMSTAGSGDVLTGIITSFLAQGYTQKEAAIFGVFVHGLAGDIAFQKLGMESMISTDIIENLNTVFQELKLNGKL